MCHLCVSSGRKCSRQADSSFLEFCVNVNNLCVSSDRKCSCWVHQDRTDKMHRKKKKAGVAKAIVGVLKSNVQKRLYLSLYTRISSDLYVYTCWSTCRTFIFTFWYV